MLRTSQSLTLFYLCRLPLTLSSPLVVVSQNTISRLNPSIVSHVQHSSNKSVIALPIVNHVQQLGRLLPLLISPSMPPARGVAPISVVETCCRPHWCFQDLLATRKKGQMRNGLFGIYQETRGEMDYESAKDTVWLYRGPMQQ